ncbi:MAG: ATP-binding protein, partial [Pyrinomonadaceae bacterium]
MEAVSQGLYPDRKHILREFVQNAYDALADLRARDSTAVLEPIEITAMAPSIIIADKGIGMSRETMRRYRYLGFSPKEIGVHAGFRGIGKFSAISACDRLIVRSSRLGEAKSYQVEIDAAGMFKRLKEEKNPPLEVLLQEYSQIHEGDERAESHYTVVELHSIHDDAKDLLDLSIIRPYLTETVPVPFDPEFPYGEEISERLHQVDKRFLEVPLLLNKKPVHKRFLPMTSRPEFKPVFAPNSDELLAFAWSCQNQEKGQFQESTQDGKTRRHPYGGLRYRMANFAVGDST